MEQNTETTPQEQPAAESPEKYTWEEIETLVQEAREEGYRKGRNEQIDELMKQPPMFGSRTTSQPSDAAATKPEEPFLRHIRPSVWD